MANNEIKAFVVESQDSSGLTTIRSKPLAIGMSRVAVAYSAVNYKDAMAAKAHPGIAKNLPHIPGIDAVGKLVEVSGEGDGIGESHRVGDLVLVTGRGLGVSHWGAWAEEIVVPNDWVLPLPSGIKPVEAMALGTAGFTAAQCIEALQLNGVLPDAKKTSLPVVVTGASGGVGSLAVRLLVQLGYRVTAVSGKPEFDAQLRTWGAEQVIRRQDWDSPSDRPLLSGQFSGAVDTVGGRVLENLLKQIAYRGAIAACGLAGGAEIQTTVYPFLLRGITLAGIDSAECPMKNRLEIWSKLSEEWRLENLLDSTTMVELEQVANVVDAMLAGRTRGRTIVRICGD